ncbi:ribosome-binding protein aMBF1 (putative translation factor)/quercetin dioxygenase-like cupin family protein [Dietzia sp. 2505]
MTVVSDDRTATGLAPAAGAHFHRDETMTTVEGMGVGRDDARRVVHQATPRELPEDVPTGNDLERIIGFHVRRLRLAEGMGVAEMSQRIGISKAMLSKIENAQTSCSLNMLAKLATGLDVPVTSLLRGADTRRDAVFTPDGQGATIVGRGTSAGHDYELLGALRGSNKRIEPVLVTLTAESEAHPRFQHPGTELLYMLSGDMIYHHAESEYRLRPGDSLLLDGEGVHGPVAMLELPIRFLSVTAYPDGVDG